MPTRENTTASAWCNLTGPQSNPKSAPLREPNGPSHLVGSAAALQHEIAELQKIPAATSVVGAHVLERLRLKPDDPDLPWLLYVTVQSTRGGCIGPDNGSISRKAFNALHRRFDNSEWAEKTPVWYR